MSSSKTPCIVEHDGNDEITIRPSQEDTDTTSRTYEQSANKVIIPYLIDSVEEFRTLSRLRQEVSPVFEFTPGRGCIVDAHSGLEESQGRPIFREATCRGRCRRPEIGKSLL
jgi:hypothetical protein